NGYVQPTATAPHLDSTRFCRPGLMSILPQLGVNRPCRDLFPNYLSKRLIDPVLPARSGFLKMIKNVPVNSQRDKLLGIRDSRTFRREFRPLRGSHLERSFGRIP